MPRGGGVLRTFFFVICISERIISSNRVTVYHVIRADAKKNKSYGKIVQVYVSH